MEGAIQTRGLTIRSAWATAAYEAFAFLKPNRHNLEHSPALRLSEGRRAEGQRGATACQSRCRVPPGLPARGGEPVITPPRRPIGLALIFLIAGASSGTAQQLPEPYTPSERWSLYLHRTYGPARMGLLAVDTAIDQVLREPACWNSGAASYGRRYARAFQSRVVRNSAELVSGLLTGEDLRYHASRSLSIHGRLWNALRASVTAQMPDGTKRPSYTRFFANELANVSTARWARQPIRPEWLMKSLAYSTLDQAETNILDEFGPDLRRVGIKVWKRVHPH
jgi:hypothetical protein